MGAQVLGCSVDHVPCLTRWAESLGGVTFPLLSDFWPHGAVAESFGVLRADGFADRAVFIIDRSGVVRYGRVFQMDHAPETGPLLDELRRIDPQAAAQEPPPPAAAEIPQAPIVMYCTPWCSDCRRAREWLRQRQLEYAEVDIHANTAAAQRVREWADGKLITPTFDIEGTIVVNFDEGRLAELLAR